MNHPQQYRARLTITENKRRKDYGDYRTSYGWSGGYKADTETLDPDKEVWNFTAYLLDDDLTTTPRPRSLRFEFTREEARRIAEFFTAKLQDLDQREAKSDVGPEARK